MSNCLASAGISHSKIQQPGSCAEEPRESDKQLGSPTFDLLMEISYREKGLRITILRTQGLQLAVKYPHRGDVEALPQVPRDLKAMADFSKLSTDDRRKSARKSVHSMILSAMAAVCLSFVAIFGVPVALQRRNGYQGAEEAMAGLGFSAFVILDALTFFSALGVVAILILVQAKGTLDVDVLLTCRRVVYVALGCAAAAVVAAAYTFVAPPWQPSLQ